mgnify:FL=1|jgi:tRNA(adenine34) deaminase
MELTPEYFMNKALQQAEIAFSEDEVPVGAVVVANNQIIGKGYNQVERLGDPTAHAEMIAITAACSFLNAKFLNECTLYVTLEPCLMCYGAIKNARIKEIVLGCMEPKHGFSNWIPLTDSISITKDVLGNQSAELMRTFFSQKRKQTVKTGLRH